ncbi:MAG: tRNA glutamyl-Q(34) synthetase GluQRS [Polyangiales bacterium]
MTLARGRFAPTPSGALHVGSARTALASALSAWSAGGRWMLRVEDLDASRARPGAVDAMLADLRWLGLRWDEGPDAALPHAPYLQSQRGPLYRAALDALRDRGLVYPCACSRREVEEAARAPHAAEPVYPGTCRGLDPDAVFDRARALRREVAWRFRCDPAASRVTFVDRVVGERAEDVAREVGDFVVFRGETAAYQLAVVVDDITQAVTEVVRGDDLLGSTARQVLLYRALGATAPTWAHVPLVLGDDGARMAKRTGSMSVASLRERGVDPRGLLRALLESLGAEPRDDPRAVARAWRIEDVPRAPWVWREGALAQAGT